MEEKNNESNPLRAADSSPSTGSGRTWTTPTITDFELSISTQGAPSGASAPDSGPFTNDYSS